MSYKYLVASALQEELDEFTNLLQTKPSQLGNEVELYLVNSGGEQIEILTYSSNKMGMPYNAAKLMEIITKFNPRFSFFIGICAGLKGYPIGSVLIPQRVFSYESGKFEKGNFLPDYLAYDTSNILRKQSESLKYKLKEALNYEVSTDEELCSGAAVIDDKDKMAEILKNSARKLAGLDMESYSVACINQILSGKNDLLVIKGISDFAHNKDSDQNETKEINGKQIKGRDLAKKNASHFAYELIKLIEEKKIINNQQINPLKILSFTTFNERATYPLKLNFQITNISKEMVTVVSNKFEFGNTIILAKNAGINFDKPMFLKENSIKHVYKDHCTLKPDEAVYSCWIPIDTGVDEKFLKEALQEIKIGKWNYSCGILGGEPSYRDYYMYV